LPRAFPRFHPPAATRTACNDIDALGVNQAKRRWKMNRERYSVVQDFLHVLMMGVVTGVLFSMAVTGVVFLISGQGHA
jgi:hypothetical protein